MILGHRYLEHEMGTYSYWIYKSLNLVTSKLILHQTPIGTHVHEVQVTDDQAAIGFDLILVIVGVNRFISRS